MKKIIFLLFFLLIPFCANAQKTYLFENFYYGMSKSDIEKIEKIEPTKDTSCWISDKLFYIGKYEFNIFFTFDNRKKLKNITLFRQLITNNYNEKEFINYKVMEFVNSFSTKFFYFMDNNFFYNRADMQTFNNSIKNGLYFYYAIGKDTYIKIKNKSDGTFTGFINSIGKNYKIVEISFIKDCLSIDFKIFKDIYKKGEPLFEGAQYMKRMAQ